jgi:hypothetical protein
VRAARANLVRVVVHDFDVWVVVAVVDFGFVLTTAAGYLFGGIGR